MSSARVQSSCPFTANSPPHSGSCSVNRTTGVALMDVFGVTCSSWVDQLTDLPLQYSYAYVVRAVLDSGIQTGISTLRFCSPTRLNRSEHSDSAPPITVFEGPRLR
jgi:hypothetical protein